MTSRISVRPLLADTFFYNMDSFVIQMLNSGPLVSIAKRFDCSTSIKHFEHVRDNNCRRVLRHEICKIPQHFFMLYRTITGKVYGWFTWNNHMLKVLLCKSALTVHTVLNHLWYLLVTSSFCLLFSQNLISKWCCWSCFFFPFTFLPFLVINSQ